MHSWMWTALVMCALLLHASFAQQCQTGTSRTLDASHIKDYQSMAIASTTFPIISYRDNTNGTLNVHHCASVDCSIAGASRTLDRIGDVGYFTSIAIGSDGNPIIAHLDFQNDTLKVFHCDSVDCSNGTARVLDSGGWFTSITIGSDAFPLISYYDDVLGDLKLYRCTSVACSNGSARTLDSVGSVGLYTSIAIGSDRFAVISYFDSTNGDLKLYHCASINCSMGVSFTLDSVGNVGEYTSIAIGADTFPVISYYDITNGDLKFYHCASVDCSNGSALTLDSSSGNVGLYTSIAIGNDGATPVISYYDSSNAGLKLYNCTSLNCSSGNTLALANNVGFFTSIAIGTDALPIISFFDGTFIDLNVYHCGLSPVSATPTPTVSPSPFCGPAPVALCEPVSAVCVAGVWQLQCNGTSVSGAPLVLLAPVVVVVVVVTGVLTLPATLIISANSIKTAGSIAVRVNGTLTLGNASVVLVVTSLPGRADPPLVLFDATGGIDGAANVTVDDSAVAAELRKCEHVVATPQRTGTTFSVLLGVERSRAGSCATHDNQHNLLWIEIVVPVVTVLLLCSAAGAVIVLLALWRFGLCLALFRYEQPEDRALRKQSRQQQHRKNTSLVVGQQNAL